MKFKTNHLEAFFIVRKSVQSVFVTQYYLLPLFISIPSTPNTIRDYEMEKKILFQQRAENIGAGHAQIRNEIKVIEGPNLMLLHCACERNNLSVCSLKYILKKSHCASASCPKSRKSVENLLRE